MKLLRKWRTIKRDSDTSLVDFEKKELEDVAFFMLGSVGVRLQKKEQQERPVTPEEHGGKQMRPRMSEVEVMEMMKEFFEDMVSAPNSSAAQQESKTTFIIDLDPSEEGFEHAKDMFNAFHAQCQEWSVFSLMHPILMELIPFVYVLAAVLNYRDHEEYYVALFQKLLNKSNYEPKEGFTEIQPKILAAALPAVPHWDLYSIISHLVRERTTSENLGTIPKQLTKKSLQILVILAAGRNLIGTNVKLECQLWIGQDWNRRLGLSGNSLKSFYNIMKDVRTNPAGKANNLMRLFEFNKREVDYLILAPKILLLKFQTDAFAGVRSIEPTKCTYATREEIFNISLMRWKHDIRKRNVEVMLDSTRPILIATNVL